MVSSANSAPVTRPVLPRTSSATSGFFFCGIIELPVAKASGSSTKPNSSVAHSTSSSARRERCTAEIAAAARNSTAASRSATASTLLAVTRAKPSWRATKRRSRGKPAPASARAAVAEARPVARQHLVIGEQVVREEDRLRALEVRVAGEECCAMAAGERGERALHAGQGGVDGVALGAQPEAQVERHLIVPAPAGVELPADRADELGEAPLDRHVDVLVGGQEAEAAGVELAAHAREPLLEARALAPGEEPRAHQRAHVRHAAGDVVRVEAAVEGQGGREGLGRGGGRRGEASGPRLRRPRPGAAAIHGLLRSTSALMRSRRPE